MEGIENSKKSELILKSTPDKKKNVNGGLGNQSRKKVAIKIIRFFATFYLIVY